MPRRIHVDLSGQYLDDLDNLSGLRLIAESYQAVQSIRDIDELKRRYEAIVGDRSSPIADTELAPLRVDLLRILKQVRRAADAERSSSAGDEGSD
jgi:hypothetical protein